MRHLLFPFALSFALTSPAQAPAAPPAGSSAQPLAISSAGVAPALPAASGAVDEHAVAFFREEGLQRSQVMDHLSWLCDVHGPRLTGSPNLRNAQAWAERRFGEIGLSARREQWGPFGRGWRCDHVAMAVVGDNPWPVIAYAKAWSPSIDGPIEADVVHVAQLDAEALAALDLAGKVVLLDDVRPVAEPFDGLARRHDAESLLRLADQQRIDTMPAAERAAAARSANDFRIGFQKRRQILATVFEKGPLAVVDRGSKGDYGTVFVSGATSTGEGSARDAGAAVVPQFTIAVEHYNRMCRLLAKGFPVRVSIDLRTTYFEQDLHDYNVIAELEGGDAVLRDEVAMFGAHLDSWHSSTGATDNGCGSAVVIEAARLIAAYCALRDVRPRRTVRAALWSGEEQGLLGSKAWVAEHLGSADEPREEHRRIAGYFNLDNGTGRVRGVYLQGNEAVAPLFRRWLQPFHRDGASTLTLDDTGSTDHVPFHRVGVPGFQFIQDPVAYSTRTHHSNMDGWDHAVAEDLQQAAVIMATFVWQTAQNTEPLPRHAVPAETGRRERR